MRTAIAAVLAFVLCGVPGVAQAQPDSHKGIKVIVGIGALALGTAIAANSSESTRVSSAGGSTETSSFSSSQLITGLAIAGAGGIVLWDGLRDHGDHYPSTQSRPRTLMGVGVAKHAAGVFIRRNW